MSIDIEMFARKANAVLSVIAPGQALMFADGEFKICDDKSGELVEGLDNTAAVQAWVDAHGDALAEGLAAQARAKRQQLLVECDWSQLPDVKQELREAYAGYRQALRDIPEQAGFPHDIEWPVKP